MKPTRRMKISLAAVLPLLFLLGTYPGAEEAAVSRVLKVDRDKRELHVANPGGKPFRIGEKVSVREGDRAVVFRVTFPMVHFSRCVPDKGGELPAGIAAGAPVYRGVSGGLEAPAAEDRAVPGRENKVGGIEMVKVPGGTFTMGSNFGGLDASDYRKKETPAHRVTVSGFWMGKYEVTQSEYQKIMGVNPSVFKGSDLPVENVTWQDAMNFCEKLSKLTGAGVRLPYEAEWEYACRAGSKTAFYWGDSINRDYCWFAENAENKTHPVGKKKPNAFGLFDMSGNVWEYCMDFFDDNYYSASPAVNPTGPAGGSDHVVRGGSWINDGDCGRSAYRAGPGYWDNHVRGFRIVVTVK